MKWSRRPDLRNPRAPRAQVLLPSQIPSASQPRAGTGGLAGFSSNLLVFAHITVGPGTRGRTPPKCNGVAGSLHLPPDATPGGTSCHHTHWDPFSAEPCTAVHLRPTMSPPVHGWIPPDSPGALGGRCLWGPWLWQPGATDTPRPSPPFAFGAAAAALVGDNGFYTTRKCIFEPVAARLPAPSRALPTRASGSPGRRHWLWHQRRCPKPLLRPPTRTARAHHFEPPLMNALYSCMRRCRARGP